MNDSQFELDIEAMRLFKQIEGLAQEDVNTYYIDEQRRLNDWRKCMVEFAHGLAFTLNSFRLSDTVIKNKDDLQPIIENMEVLAQIPAKDNDRKVMIRHRGLVSADEGSGSESTADHDYVISAGDCIIDNQTLDYLIKNNIMDEKELTRKLNRAFRFFHHFNIYILEVSFGDWELRDKQLVDACMLLWARYFNRTKNTGGVIYNEEQMADPNLTILAGLNGLKTEKFQDVVNKVHKAMVSEKQREKLSKATSIFEAIFMIEELGSKLVRPAVEINNNVFVNMWRKCFDEKGRFDRNRFNQFRASFLTWESAFYVIWVDLKSVTSHEDRTTILSCIVRFVLDSPKMNEYIDFILKDFFYYPLYVNYSDRNCLFLTNILLYADCANLGCDFGRTPGEFLFANASRNEALVERLRGRIKREWGDRFLDKLKTFKTKMTAVLGEKKPQKDDMPFSFMVNTLRELFIFLTITWDSGFYDTVKKTVEEMGDPKFEWYQSRNSSENLAVTFNFFQLVLMCLSKLGSEKDIELLRTVKGREKEFSSLKGIMNADLSSHQMQIKKFVGSLDETVSALRKKKATDASDNAG
jgi:hypothetical protein